MDCLRFNAGSESLADCVGMLPFSTWLTHHPWLALFLATGVVLLPFLIVWLRAHRQGHRQANSRAEKLLRDSLPRPQYQQLERLGYLDLPSQLDPGRTYRIPRLRGRVQVYESYLLGSTLLRRKTAELCVIACEPVPDADLILAHKWMIEADEVRYLSTANWIKTPHSWVTSPYEELVTQPRAGVAPPEHPVTTHGGHP
jgi:hypothetical protein